MTSERKAETLRRLFAAFKAKDRALAEQLLADGFTFTSPYDDAIDRATWFERCWPNSDRLREQVLERILVQGDEAFVTYRAVTQDGSEFRNTEFFTFSGDRIASVDVYFGATYKDGAFVPQT
jgi:ketosteroid isomerase-like protein